MNVGRAELLEKMALDGTDALDAVHTLLIAYNLLYQEGKLKDIDYLEIEMEAKKILARRKEEGK